MSEFEWGPAMAALTERERRYVMEMAVDPFGNPSRWAVAAGYPERPNGNHRVQGHRLSHSGKISAAIFEYARVKLFTEGPILAVAGLLQIARDKDHPKQMQALEGLANRVGLHETTEHTVKVEHRDLTGDAMIERIKALAAKLGLEEGKLVGANVSRETKVIEHKADE